MPGDTQARLDALEEHVSGQAKDNPGILMRLDRLEWFMRALLALATLGTLWKVLDVFGQFIAHQALKP